MSDDIIISTVSDEALESMHTAAEALVDALMAPLPKMKESDNPVHYDRQCQHSVFGNGVIRLLIAMSEKIGPLDMDAIRSAGFQAMIYVNTIAEPIGEDPPTVN